MGLRQLWHRLWRGHMILKKDGLAEIHLCWGRLRRDVDLGIEFADDTYDVVIVRDVNVEDANKIFAAQTAMEMRRIAVAIREGSNA